MQSGEGKHAESRDGSGVREERYEVDGDPSEKEERNDDEGFESAGCEVAGAVTEVPESGRLAVGRGASRVGSQVVLEVVPGAEMEREGFDTRPDVRSRHDRVEAGADVTAAGDGGDVIDLRHDPATNEGLDRQYDF